MGCRWSLLLQAVELSPTGRSEVSLRATDVVLRMCSRHCAPVMDTASTIVAYLPPHLDSMLDSWATVLVNVCNWVSCCMFSLQLKWMDHR